MSGAPDLPPGLEVVSFDIFDTLLHRRLRAPVDLFELVRLKAFETDFGLLHHDFLDGYAVHRRAAEADARKLRRQVAEEGEILLDDIFARLQADHDLPDAFVGFLRESELSLEDAVLFASPEGRALYDKARQAGLVVAFISDMYLPEDWLAAKLEREGFEGAATLPLYVSGAHGATKHSGRLYRIVAQEQGWALDRRWLHVGDNRKADIDQAEAEGLATRLADWHEIRNRPQPQEPAFGLNAIQAITEFSAHPPARCFQPDGALEGLGYRVFGPLLFGFTLWLLAQSRQRGLDLLLFIARDGHLPRQLFDRIKERAGCGHVRSDYFHMSRKAGYLTGMREWDREQTRRITIGRKGKSARRSFQAVRLDAENYREELARFGIVDIDATVPPEDAGRVIAALDSCFIDVLRRNAETRAELQSYYLDALAGRAPIGFVDIGWVGNIQRLFVNSLPDPSMREQVTGLYLGQLPSSSFNAARGIRMECFLTQGAYRDPVQKALHAGGLELLEFALTADHGTTVDLVKEKEGRITPVLEERSAEELAYAGQAMRVQAGIRRFVEEHLWLLDHFDVETIALPHWGQPLLRLVMDPSLEEVEILSELTHSDALGANSDRLPMVAQLSGWRRYSPSHRRAARVQSFWKAGFDRLLSER